MVLLLRTWAKITFLVVLGTTLFMLQADLIRGTPHVGSLSSFYKAQNEQARFFIESKKSEIASLKASQEIQIQKWDEQARLDQDEYFEKDQDPDAQESYLRGLQMRKTEFQERLAQEARQFEIVVYDEIADLKKQQEFARKKFREALDRGISPSLALWPTNPGNDS